MPSKTSSKKSQSKEQSSVDWARLHREGEARFGVKKFWPGQREIIEHVMNGRDVLGVLPTGGGKSLTYQLPSLLLPKSVVVVSPLIALMQDQQEKAEDAEIGAAKLEGAVAKLIGSVLFRNTASNSKLLKSV